MKAEKIIKLLQDNKIENFLCTCINECDCEGSSIKELEQDMQDAMGDSWTHVNVGCYLYNDEDIEYDEMDNTIIIGESSVDVDDYPDDEDDEFEDIGGYGHPEEFSDSANIVIYLDNLDTKLVDEIKEIVC